MLWRVSAVDPALSNMGLAKFDLALNVKAVPILSNPEIKLVSTEPADKATRKVVRKSSDDLRRCGILLEEFERWCDGTRVCFGEVPTGGQSASAAKSFGAVTMMLAACPTVFIQVQPSETKEATGLSRNASKAEIIDWAHVLYPSLPWLRYEKDSKKHKKGDLHEHNEHMADAIAVAYAGIRTEQFRQLLSLWRAAA